MTTLVGLGELLIITWKQYCRHRWSPPFCQAFNRWR